MARRAASLWFRMWRAQDGKHEQKIIRAHLGIFLDLTTIPKLLTSVWEGTADFAAKVSSVAGQNTARLACQQKIPFASSNVSPLCCLMLFICGFESMLFVNVCMISQDCVTCTVGAQLEIGRRCCKQHIESPCRWRHFFRWWVLTPNHLIHVMC